MSREIPASPSAELSTWTSVTLQWGRKQLKDEFLEVSSTSCRPRPFDRRRSSRMAATGNSQVSSMGWPVKVLGTTTPIVTLARSLITGMEATDNLRNGRKHDEFWTKRNSETFDAFLDRLTVDHNGSVQWLSMAPNGFPAKGAETIRFEEVNDFDLAWSRT
ncbi:hypothetical protein NEUTE1DRAFT_110245 [Neurospora tetrasperma FGSC 2508]|uniref:Uncharacterized protein n=1 Tax=Neurospora tetrasperma (strain FGSC 2508 / ATCC MYA-4615 / P0657) TaxID=510951 RepID=F8MJR2_NEUT8|nr:uncharacterized protein NEUTE1DRAFT_110245 [Neurospora tetrasperma FGSC 2508]EGO58099.1 hypothetical protein NEUTE1DRAFT_110245 [Neurospora tetrasperma FGSC 2508]